MVADSTCCTVRLQLHQARHRQEPQLRDLRRATARRSTEALKLFEADVTRQTYTPGKSHLVVSPENARAMLTAFIAGAKKELAIYDAKVQDPSMIKLLKERAAKGVTVRVHRQHEGQGSAASTSGSSPTMRLHVRAIVRDGTQAFVGSQSLRKDELENRREVGLIINNPGVAQEDHAGVRGGLGGLGQGAPRPRRQENAA